MRDAVFEPAFDKVEDWLLAILRFAITREEADRAAILAMAAEMDQLGAHAARSDFAFFARTSVEICDLIVGKDHPERIAALRRHIGMIDNDRLRRALEAVLEIEPPRTNGRRARSRRSEALWRGLPIRH
jgi:hypothetical protein